MQTVDLIDLIVQQLTRVVRFNTVTKAGNAFNIESNCTYWLMNGMKINIEGVFYKVSNLVMNTSFTLTPSINVLDIGVTEFDLVAPTYFHGTLKMTRNEVSAETKKSKILPMVYLFEVIRDRKVNSIDSLIDRESELRIFFLGNVDTQNWLTDSHYENIINPLSVMVEMFISLVGSNKFFTDEFDYETINLINVSENGEQRRSIFDCDLSGIELRLFSQIRKDLGCSENICLN